VGEPRGTRRVAVDRQPPAVLMEQVVMMRAEQDEILLIRRTAMEPVLPVVAFAPGGWAPAAGEDAAAITGDDGSPQRRAGRTRAAAQIEDCRSRRPPGPHAQAGQSPRQPHLHRTCVRSYFTKTAGSKPFSTLWIKPRNPPAAHANWPSSAGAGPLLDLDRIARESSRCALDRNDQEPPRRIDTTRGSRCCDRITRALSPTEL
jgi:hypothetical protein